MSIPRQRGARATSAPVVSRRGLLSAAGLTAVAGTLAACGGAKESVGAAESERDDEEKLSAAEALELLKEGNERFAGGEVIHPDASKRRRSFLGTGQHPFAAILSCADSRVPPELVFDQGLGDLFVMRSAGQVLDDAILGTLEYGVEHLHVPLVVVLGHSACGAVKATIETIETKAGASGTHIDALVAAITPAVEEAEESADSDKALLLTKSIEINVERLVAALKKNTIVAEAEEKAGVAVVGAVYQLASGRVEWIGELPEPEEAATHSATDEATKDH